MVLIAKTKLNSIEVLISRTYERRNQIFKDFIRPSDLAHTDKVSDRMQQFIKDFSLFMKQCFCIVWSEVKKQIVKTQGFQRPIKES